MSEDTRERILRACGDFLVPVARFLLRAGVGYREFSEIAKNAFVRVATDEYGLRRRKTNISRVAVMTGLTRKEVRKRRDQGLEFHSGIPMSPAAMVLHGWFTDSDFLGADNKPRDLPFEGTADSFAGLVKRYAGDIPAGAMRTELRRAHAVVDLEDGKVKAVRRHFVPVDYDDRLIASISVMLRGLAETIAHNANPGRLAAGRFQRFAYSDRVSSESIPRFRAMSRERAETFIEMIDDWIASNEDRDLARPPRRVGIGVFYYEDDTRDPDEK